jgi:hypothetical protein
MINSGYSLRSISSQESGVFETSVRFVNQPSDFQIGLTGDGFFGLTCSNGLISVDGSIISSLNTDTKDFKIKFSYDSFDLFINGVESIHGQSKSSGVYDNILINSSSEIEYSCFVSGSRPSLEAQVLNTAESGNNIVNVFFENLTPSRSFRFFNASVDSTHSSRFSISGWETGVCQTGCLIQMLSLEDQPLNSSGIKINIDSNFGKFSTIVNVESSFTGGSEIFSISPNQDTSFSTQGSKIFNVLSYYRGAARNLEVSLEYVSGGLSNQLRSLESGNISGFVSGFLLGGGTITSPAVNYLTGVVGMSGFIFSGNASGDISATYYHTGSIIRDFSVLNSGVVPSGSRSGETFYLSSGSQLSGFILDGSGSYVFNKAYSGYYLSGGVHIPMTGYVNSTEFLYYSEGRTGGIGTSGLNIPHNGIISGFYSGTTLISSISSYYYNQSGFSGFVTSTLSGVYVPTGIYSKLISGMAYAQDPSLNDISGMISGYVSGIIDNENGYQVFEGSLTGNIPYTYLSCVASDTRLAGELFPTVTNYTDGYGNWTGSLYSYNFSPTREYLIGSGKPCNFYLSGYILLYDYTGYLISLPDLNIELRKRSNNSLISSTYITDFVRNHEVDLGSGVTYYTPIYRTSVISMTGVDFDDDLYITGRYIAPSGWDESESRAIEYNNNIFHLDLVPFFSGTFSGNVSASVDYSHTGYLTGSGSVLGSGNLSGQVSGIWTLLEGSGSGSGIMLGPEVPVDFKDMWNLKSGYGLNVYDFKESGWFTFGQSGKFENPAAAMITSPNIFNEPFIQVDYDRSLNKGVSIAKLSVFDGYNSEEILISGF